MPDMVVAIASLGRQELNLRLTAYQAAALTGLSYTPSCVEIREGVEPSCLALQASTFTTSATGSRYSDRGPRHRMAIRLFTLHRSDLN